MNKNIQNKILLLAGLITLLAGAPLFAANISVPSLEIYSWGRIDGGEFAIDSYGDIEVQLDGGYKFGGAIMFDFSSLGLETAAFNDVLSFKSASITLRDLFNIPLDFTYFIGEGDTFADGGLFTTYFGSPLIESDYTSYIHFPSTTSPPAPTYEGIHTINGTGMKLDLAPEEKNWLVALYLYQDNAFNFGPPPSVTLDYGYASMDIRSAFNFEKIKLEAFLGATYPTPDSTIGYYRSGFLFWAGIGGIEFLAELGLPRLRPLNDSFSFDLFYMLIEQRVRLGLLSIVQTVFWRPAYYEQVATGAKAIDINLDIQVGSPEKSLFSGGVEGNFVYQSEDNFVSVNEIRAKIAPYVKLSTSGVVFELRASTKVWPFDFSDMFEAFVSAKASF